MYNNEKDERLHTTHVKYNHVITNKVIVTRHQETPELTNISFFNIFLHRHISENMLNIKITTFPRSGKRNKRRNSQRVVPCFVSTFSPKILRISENHFTLYATTSSFISCELHARELARDAKYARKMRHHTGAVNNSNRL